MTSPSAPSQPAPARRASGRSAATAPRPPDAGSATQDRLRSDFRLFLCLIWRHLQLPDPTPVQYDVAAYLQHGPRRKMVMAFRGVGKSSIYAAFACWRLWVEPDRKVLLVSATKTHADGLSSFIRRLIAETPILAPLTPRSGGRDGVSCFDVGPARPAKDPSLRSVGVTGQITGARADEILADDVETLANAMSADARLRLSERVREFDAVLTPGGRITYLGTPQSGESVYWRLPERGYALRIWPAQAPDHPARYRGRLAPFVRRMREAGASPGAPVDPGRFGRADLAERRRSYGPTGYALQFMLDPSANDGFAHPLKLADLTVHPLGGETAPLKVAWTDAPADLGETPSVGLAGDRFAASGAVSPEVARYDGAVLAVDPSGRGRDETGFAVVKILNGQLFLTAAGGLAGGYDDDTLEALAKIADEQRVSAVVVEANFGDGMFARLLQPHLARRARACRIVETRHIRAKERRILETLEPVLMQHRLIVDPAVVAADYASARDDLRFSLFFQLTRLSRRPGALSYDDRVDALAMAVSYWGEALSRDVDKGVERQRDRAREGALTDFARDARRGGPKRKLNLSGKSPRRRW